MDTIGRYLLVSGRLYSLICRRYGSIGEDTLCLSSTVIDQIRYDLLMDLWDSEVELSVVLVMDHSCMDNLMLLASCDPCLHSLSTDMLKFIRDQLIGHPWYFRGWTG